jgi:hypothetical protein
MSFLSFFTKKRIPNPTQGNTQFVKGYIFDPGAEVWSTESRVGDPAYVTRVFPQWNFQPLQVFQAPMVFQALSLPTAPPQGYPFGGLQDTGLIDQDNLPDVAGTYYS